MTTVLIVRLELFKLNTWIRTEINPGNLPEVLKETVSVIVSLNSQRYPLADLKYENKTLCLCF